MSARAFCALGAIPRVLGRERSPSYSSRRRDYSRREESSRGCTRVPGAASVSARRVIHWAVNWGLQDPRKRGTGSLMKNLRFPWVLGMALVSALGCTQGHSEEEKQQAAAGGVDASARVSPTQGNQVEGTVTLQKVSGGIRVLARLNGL